MTIYRLLWLRTPCLAHRLLTQMLIDLPARKVDRVPRQSEDSAIDGAGSRAGFQFQQDDLEMLSWLARFGYMTTAQLARMLARPRHVVQRRIQRMKFTG